MPGDFPRVIDFRRYVWLLRTADQRDKAGSLGQSADWWVSVSSQAVDNNLPLFIVQYDVSANETLGTVLAHTEIPETMFQPLTWQCRLRWNVRTIDQRTLIKNSSGVGSNISPLVRDCVEAIPFFAKTGYFDENRRHESNLGPVCLLAKGWEGN